MDLPTAPLFNPAGDIDVDWISTSSQSTQISWSRSSRKRRHRTAINVLRGSIVQKDRQKPAAICASKTKDGDKAIKPERFYYEPVTALGSTSNERPTRQYPTRVFTDQQIRTAIKNRDCELLNHIASTRKLAGCDMAYLDMDEHGHGVCLRVKRRIEVKPGQPLKLWEYTGMPSA